MIPPRLVIAVAALLGTLIGVPAAQAQSEPLVVTAFGGAWADAVKKNYVQCFKQRTGADPVVSVGLSNEFAAKTRASPANPPFGVLMLSEMDAYRAMQDGLLDKLTVEKVPNLNKIPAKFRDTWDDYAAVANYGGLGILYNKEKITDPPKDWKEFFLGMASGKYGDKVSMMSMTYSWGPEFYWFVKDIMGYDDDQMFDLISKMAPHVVKFWTNSVEGLSLFSNREVDLVTIMDGRGNNFVDKNKWASFFVPGPHTMAGSVVVAKAKNAPESAWIYIDCVLAADAQAGFAADTLYGVSNEDIVYPDAIKDKVTAARNVVVPPSREIAGHVQSWLSRWNRTVR